MTNAPLSGETICFTPSGGDPFQSGPLTSILSVSAMGLLLILRRRTTATDIVQGIIAGGVPAFFHGKSLWGSESSVTGSWAGTTSGSRNFIGHPACQVGFRFSQAGARRPSFGNFRRAPAEGVPCAPSAHSRRLPALSNYCRNWLCLSR